MEATFLSWCHVNLVSRTPFQHFNIEIKIVQGSMSGNLKTTFFEASFAWVLRNTVEPDVSGKVTK